jgi:hypothetical protein
MYSLEAPLERARRRGRHHVRDPFPYALLPVSAAAFAVHRASISMEPQQEGRLQEDSYVDEQGYASDTATLDAAGDHRYELANRSLSPAAS